MNTLKLAHGDNNDTCPMSSQLLEAGETNRNKISTEICQSDSDKKLNLHSITVQEIDGNEEQLKERIDQCKSIIESLKHELHEEKFKLEKEVKSTQDDTTYSPRSNYLINVNKDLHYNKLNSEKYSENELFGINSHSACLSCTLNCDENLMEYEKQLQRYQNTLNMAQIEKKNAIRKQMLSKAFNLKLLEVENQCNIELLRVKQSLQCLEPLRMIANNWKVSSDSSCDFNNFERIPRFPELNSIALTDFRTVDDNHAKVGCDKGENNSVKTEDSLG